MKNSKNMLVENRAVVYTENPPFPRNMLIEVANVCNHRCVFCGCKDMKRPRMMCDENITYSVLEEAYELGTREVGFYMLGEPLLNDKLGEYIAYAKKIGYTYVYLTTNGSLATSEKLVKLIDSGLDSIKFSVNGATPEDYYKVHGSNDFYKVKENIKWLRHYIDNNDIALKTFISFIKCNYNRENKKLMQKEFGDLVDRIYFYQCWNQGGGSTHLLEQGVIDEFRTMKAPCSMIFNALYVTCEGYLDACCGDTEGKLLYADLHKKSLKDAWNSKAIVALRKEHINGITSNTNCYNCIYNTDNNANTLYELYGDE